MGTCTSTWPHTRRCTPDTTSVLSMVPFSQSFIKPQSPAHPPAPASHPASLWAAEAWCSGGTAELCGPGHWGGVAPRQHSLLSDSGAAALAESRGLQVVWLFWKLVPFRKLLDVTRQLSASLCWGNRQNVCPPAEGSHLSPFPHTWALSDLCLGSSELEFGSAFWLKCLG